MFFIDYGNTEMLRGDQLVPVDARIKTIYRRIVSVPAAAIECSLAETRPNPARNTRGIWDSEVLGIFKGLVLNTVRGRLSLTIPPKVRSTDTCPDLTFNT